MVAAKRRHRPGVLGRDGTPEAILGFRAGIGRLVSSALRKQPAYPYIIFVDANMPPEVASPLSPIDWQNEVNETVPGVDVGVTSVRCRE